MFTALGLGAYYLLVSLAALDAVLLARRPVGQPLLRLTGWLLSLVGFTTLMALAVPQLSPGPVIGSGGYLGAAGRGLLEMNFATVGAYILTVSLILGGLLLSTDYLLVHIFAWVIGKPTKNLGRGMLHVGAAYAQKINRRRSDLDVYEEDAAQDAVAVRISGRPAAEDKEEDEDDEEEEESQAGEEKEADSEPADAGAASRKPPASLLRIAAPRKTPPEEVLKDLQSEGDAADYELPGIDLLLPGEPFCFEEQEKEVRRKAKILEKTFLDFGFNVRVVEIQTGPVIAQFEVELEAGLRLSKITGLADDLAIALRVPSVRIVAPHSRQEHRRHRGAQQRAADRPPPRGHGRDQRQGPEDAHPDLPGQGRVRQPHGRRPDHAAAPADRRPHRHRQERLPELDHRLDAHDAAARRSAAC